VDTGARGSPQPPASRWTPGIQTVHTGARPQARILMDPGHPDRARRWLEERAVDTGARGSPQPPASRWTPGIQTVHTGARGSPQPPVSIRRRPRGGRGGRRTTGPPRAANRAPSRPRGRERTPSQSPSRSRTPSRGRERTPSRSPRRRLQSAEAALSELRAFLAQHGLAERAEAILAATDAKAVGDLRLVDATMAEDAATAAGLRCVSAKKFRLALASLGAPAPLRSAAELPALAGPPERTAVCLDRSESIGRALCERLADYYGCMTNFIRTKCEPNIFYLPARHTEITRDLLDEARAGIFRKLGRLLPARHTAPTRDLLDETRDRIFEGRTEPRDRSRSRGPEPKAAPSRGPRVRTPRRDSPRRSRSRGDDRDRRDRQCT